MPLLVAAQSVAPVAVTVTAAESVARLRSWASRRCLSPDKAGLYRHGGGSSVERVWRAIAGEHFYPTPSPMQCPECPFRGPCRAWQG